MVDRKMRGCFTPMMPFVSFLTVFETVIIKVLEDGEVEKKEKIEIEIF